MGVSAYLFNKERSEVTTSQKLIPAMLQRERSGQVSIVDFKSDDQGVNYKISEEQLDEFAKKVKDLKETQSQAN